MKWGLYKRMHQEFGTKIRQYIVCSIPGRNPAPKLFLIIYGNFFAKEEALMQCQHKNRGKQSSSIFGTQKLSSQTTVSPVPVSGRNGRLRADQAAGAKDQSFFTLGIVRQGSHIFLIHEFWSIWDRLTLLLSKRQKLFKQDRINSVQYTQIPRSKSLGQDICRLQKSRAPSRKPKESGTPWPFSLQ